MKRLVLFVAIVVAVSGLLFAIDVAAGEEDSKPKDVLVYYSFDECKQLAYEAECYCVKGEFSCIGGVLNSAVTFWATGDYFKFKNTATDSFTVTFWMRTRFTGMDNENGKFSGCTGIVDANNIEGGKDWGVNLCGDKIGFGVEDTTILSKRNVVTGRWVFVAAVRDFKKGKIELYINGVYQGDAGDVAKKVVLDGTPEIFVGAVHAGPKYEKSFYAGCIDELTIYDKALSAGKIRKLYEELNPYEKRKQKPGEKHKQTGYEPGNI